MGINRKIVMAALGSTLGFLVWLASPIASGSVAEPCIPDDMNWCPGPVVLASDLGSPDDTNW